MSNWCEGTLKVRGIRADLEKFVVEVLKPVSQGDLSIDEYGRVASDKRCWIFYSLKNGNGTQKPIKRATINAGNKS